MTKQLPALYQDKDPAWAKITPTSIPDFLTILSLLGTMMIYLYLWHNIHGPEKQECLKSRRDSSNHLLLANMGKI